MPRPRAPLTFGAGLDRATGVGARDARTFYDARNVVAREAGLELRTGLTGSGLPALTWGTDVVAQESVNRTLDVLQVAYDRVTREMRIYRLNPVNTPTRQLVGSWGTLAAGAQFPIVTMAEAGGVVFFAHAEESMAFRLPTKYWTPGPLDTDAGTLATATADFDGSGAPGDIYFYGVCAYREYIVGWGWGTETDNTTKDRPEIVRLSKPDNPTVFPAESYFLCGSRSTRVVGCTPMPSGLLVGSRTQRYTIFGTDPETFGVELTDPSHGIVSPRAWRTINGVAYTWSQTGPRVTEDPMAPSRDLALPLDLMQAVPAEWPRRGPAREAFAGYDPEQRVLYWVWPDLMAASASQTMSYACSLRSPSEPRFSVAIFERRLACAGTYLSGKAAPPPGSAYANAVAAVDDGWIPADNGRRVTLTWQNLSFLGNEQVEVWMKAGAGAWTIRTTVALAGTTQSLPLTGLEALETYAIALRHIAPGPTYTSGYGASSPDDWTAPTAPGSKVTINTGASAPAIPTGSWSRWSAESTVVTLNLQTTDLRCEYEIELDRGSGWTPDRIIDPGFGPTRTWQVFFDNTVVGTTVGFRARLRRGALTSAWSPTRPVFCGITATAPGIEAAFDKSTSGRQAVEIWTAKGALNGLPLQVQHVESGTFLTIADVSNSPGTAATLTRQVGTAETLTLRMRRTATVAGVTDVGPWGSSFVIAVNPVGSNPSAPSSARFTAPNGTYFTSPPGVARFFPQSCTPNQLTGTTQMYLVTKLFGEDSTTLLGPYTSAENNTVVTIDGVQRFAFVQAFHVNTSTRRRSPALSLY